MISERVSVEFIHGDALSLFYVSFCKRAGRKGSALMSGRRVIFRRIFRKDHVSDGNPCFRSERK